MSQEIIDLYIENPSVVASSEAMTKMVNGTYHAAVAQGNSVEDAKTAKI